MEVNERMLVSEKLRKAAEESKSYFLEIEHKVRQDSRAI